MPHHAGRPGGIPGAPQQFGCGAVYTFLIVFLVDFQRWGRPVWYLLTAVGVSLFVGALVLIKHRANIGRLLRGEEKPIVGRK